MTYKNYLISLCFISFGITFMGCDDEKTSSTNNELSCASEMMACATGESCQETADGSFECVAMAGVEAGAEAGTEAGIEAGIEAGTEAGATAGTEAGSEAGQMAGSEAGSMAGETAGMMAIGDPLSDPLAPEIRQLAIPFDQVNDPRTVSTVLGLRHLYAETDNQIIMQFGPSFNAPEANSSEGYQIYSPDDPNYALELLSEPTSVVVAELDSTLTLPSPNANQSFNNYEVTLNLSSPLQEGAKYFVRAIGGRRAEIDESIHHRTPWTGYPLTSGRNAHSFVFGQSSADDTQVSPELIQQVMGLREITITGPKHLRLVLGAGTEPSLIQDPSAYTINSDDDMAFMSGQQALSVSHRSSVEAFLPGYGYPFPRGLFKHEVYIELGNELENGATYHVSLSSDLNHGQTTLSFTYHDDSSRNHHLKVNQLGYRSDAPVKIALLGAWLGTEGALAYEGFAGKACIVVNQDTGEEVFETTLTLKHDAVTADEGAYNQNFAQEELYQCDFSEFSESGRYVVKIPGAGCSYEFLIADSVYEEAFRTSMRGIFYQRAGQELNQDNSMYRRVASHTEAVEIPYKEDQSIIGGHYDAGDFNPRVQIEVMHILMLAYEMFPQKFYDGQLDIPENQNAIPDILDEAEWGLQSLIALQDTDGGVGFDPNTNMFIESASDPNFVEVAERDPWKQESYAKHAKGTLITAALMGMASRLWRDIGAMDKAEIYLSSAISAYEWAQQNGAENYVDTYAWAAAELAKTTREPSYLEDFRATGYALSGSFDDGSISRLRPAITLALDTAIEADFELSNLMYTYVRDVADTLKSLNNYAYPHFQHPYAPANWGTAAYPIFSESIVAMWLMSSNDTYLELMTHSADFSLGLNPLNLSWTTGLGDQAIYGTCHLLGWHNFQGVIPPGMQAEGPNHDIDYLNRFFSAHTPTPNNTPIYYNYYDVRYAIGLNEGIVRNQAWTAFLYGALLPDRN